MKGYHFSGAYVRMQQLMVACPFDRMHQDCPFDDWRKIPLIERVELIDTIHHHDQLKVLRHHWNCLQKREKACNQRYTISPKPLSDL